MTKSALLDTSFFITEKNFFNLTFSPYASPILERNTPTRHKVFPRLERGGAGTSRVANLLE